MVQYGRSSRSSWTKSVRSSFGRTVVGKAIWENSIGVRLGEGFHLGMLIRTPWKRVILICVCGWHKIGWKETKHWSDVERTQKKKLTWENQHLSLIMYTWWVFNNNVKWAKILWTNVWIQNFRRNNWKSTMLGESEYLFVVLRKEMCGTILWVGEQDDSTTLQSTTPCIDDHHFKEEELKSVGELSNVCSQNVLKCLYLTRFGRPDILWSVNKLARSITKWTKACDKRLNRLISYIHHTCEYKQYCHVGNTAKQCRLGLFQDSDFAGDLEDSKSTSGGTLCVFGSHTFVPISWMCKKQTSVSHSSPESDIISLDEIISLDAGLRMDGIPALDLWYLIVAVLENTNQSNKARWDLCPNQREVRSTPHTIQKRKRSHGVINDMG